MTEEDYGVFVPIIQIFEFNELILNLILTLILI